MRKSKIGFFFSIDDSMEELESLKFHSERALVYSKYWKYPPRTVETRFNHLNLAFWKSVNACESTVLVSSTQMNDV